MQPVLSHYQVKPLLQHRSQNLNNPAEVTLSFDLGLTQTQASLSADGLHFADFAPVSWNDLTLITGEENAVFELFDDGAVQKVSTFSEELQRSYSLFPTLSAPTMLVSGITMHRIVNCDPHQDTLNKIKAFGGPPLGKVLDTTMGLGYTAIQAARTASSVLTIEIDPAVVEICQLNPWSKGLFEKENIERRIGHSWDVIEEFPDNSFSIITHDPPMFNMAGELYSLEFYKELYRVLSHKGRLFHYIGNPKSKSGATVTRGVIRRLQEAGFTRVSSREQAFGVLATK
ncbi:MAG: putative methyltransferase [Cellvibrionaceae bacterium]|jgi:predicted methyltransferase